MKAVPWTADKEYWKRKIIQLESIAYLIFAAVAIGLAAMKMMGIAVISLAVMWVFIFDLMGHRRKLASMLENKPRNTVGLTQWVRCRPGDNVGYCACGLVVRLDHAKWFPNSVDFGGGRFSIVCSCGIGYYRLKLPGLSETPVQRKN